VGKAELNFIGKRLCRAACSSIPEVPIHQTQIFDAIAIIDQIIFEVDIGIVSNVLQREAKRGNAGRL
jgi:hypothetical protein